MTVLSKGVAYWAGAVLVCVLTMAPIGIIAYILTAPPATPKVDPNKYPGYDPVCDTGTLERMMDGGSPVRYWGPDARSTDCSPDGEDRFRKSLPRALYVTSERLSSMAVPPGDWVVQIQPGLFVSNIPPERRPEYSR